MRGFIDLYDSEIHYLDSQLSNLFKQLREYKQFSNSLIIILGDHGELFGEYGLIGHHFSLSDELLNVPLLVKWPANNIPIENNRSNSFVSLASVFKTILDLAEVKQFDGPIQPSLIENHRNNNKRVYAHYTTPKSMINKFNKQISDQFSFDKNYNTTISMVRDGPRKLTVTSDGENFCSDNLSIVNDESNVNPNRNGSKLISALKDHISQESIYIESSSGFSREVQQQLEDLGYI
jgi:arylsulfatase A-like enzyme